MAKTPNSDYTNAIKKKFWTYRIADWACLFAPVIIYCNVALFSGGVTTTGKVSVVGTVLIAIILTVFNIVAKKKITCIIWIVLIGLYVAFKEHLLPLIVIMAICNVIDNFWLGPMSEYYKVKLISAKTIDERENYKKEETK